MSRLLTTLLLYRSGFYVGKYISLEAKVAQNKDLYYEALADSQIGWHEGKEDAIPFVKYILGTILAAYKDFEERMTIIEPKLLRWKWYVEQVKIKLDALISRIFVNFVLRLATALLKLLCVSWCFPVNCKKKARGKALAILELNEDIKNRVKLTAI